ncbi:cupin domain-containing protein [Cupriavidus sp. 2TAF22]|uniref:cupin domain-containing protein n=1 Tax=unclassified Cupriavidus TaxID=2640874 RepID=UPI003F8E6229
MRKILTNVAGIVCAVSCLITGHAAFAGGLSPKQVGSIQQEDIQWSSFAAFPRRAQLSVLVGDPGKPGPYVVRVKVPGGVKLMPHVHPEDRVYTVIAGVFYIGIGNEFDPQKLTAYPPGSVVVLPGGTPHFHWARSGEYITQVSGTGPLGLEYLDPNDDPRHKPEAP